MSNQLLRFILLISVLTSSVFAQDNIALEEVVVTAQRREQNLQEVPVSVTAFTAADLLQGNINSAADYFSLTPNVGFSEDGEAGSRGINIGIRGVTNLTSGENSVINSVGIYIDEFSVVSFPTGVVNPQLLDVARIEVLRGPQGTYFGRNAVGGVMNLTTQEPTDELGGKITFGGESFEDAGEMGNVTAVLNLPVSDTFALRGVINYEDSSGMVENINPSGVDSGHEYFMGRINAIWKPSDRTTIKTTLMYSDEDQDGDETVPSGVWNVDTVDGYFLGVNLLTEAVNPGGIGFFPDNQNKNSHDLKEFNNSEGLLAILNVKHELTDDITIKSITGVIDGEIDRLFDNDLVGNWDNFFRQNQYEGTSYSTELRLEVDKEQFFWVTGVLYANDEQERNTQVITGLDTAAGIGPLGADPAGVSLLPPIPFGFCFACDSKKFELESIAVFSDFTWHATEKLDLTVGGRYTHDKVKASLTTTGPFYAPAFGPSAVIGEATGSPSFDDFSPRFALRYQVNDDLNVYGVISKGYKAGGTSLGFNFDTVNVPLPAVIETPFEEETLWNYELGFKSQWLDNRLRLNASIFYTEWSDLQLESFRFLVPGNLQSKFALTSNIDEAEAMGLEIEFAAAITDRFTVSGGIGILDTEIIKSVPQELSGAFIVDMEGLDLPKAPPFTANLVGEYRWPLATGEAWIRTEYIHREGQMSNIEALAWTQTRGRFVPNRGTGAFLPATPGGYPFLTPDYDVVNLRIGYEWNSFAVNGFVENLFDKAYFTGTAEDFGVSGIRLRPHPRIIGGSVSYSFGGI